MDGSSAWPACTLVPALMLVKYQQEQLAFAYCFAKDNTA